MANEATKETVDPRTQEDDTSAPGRGTSGGGCQSSAEDPGSDLGGPDGGRPDAATVLDEGYRSPFAAGSTEP